MSRSLTPLSAGLCALLLVACSSPRKASERACHRADRIMAKAEVRAAHRCPDAVLRDSATTRADSGTVQMHYRDADVDSVLAACDQLRDALRAERDLYESVMLQLARENVALRPTPPPAAPGIAARNALATLRSSVCDFQPIHAEFDYCMVDVRPGLRQPLLQHTHKAHKAPCPPAIQRGPCPGCEGVSPFYKIAFWVLLSAIGLLYLFTKVRAFTKTT